VEVVAVVEEAGLVEAVVVVAAEVLAVVLVDLPSL
jgi:hypothetical protein